MEKANEIKYLKMLKGDTYFADTFSNETIDRMCENIKNDFPILLGTEFEEKQRQKVDGLNAKIKTLSDQLAAKDEGWEKHIEEFGRNIVERMDDSDLVYAEVVKEFGLDFIIKAKHAKGIALNEDEINYLVSKI